MSRAIFGQPVPTGYARLTPVGGSLAFESTYSEPLVNAFKQQIPAEARKWDRDNKRWLIDPKYASVCVSLCRDCLGVDLIVPKVSTASTIETRLVQLDYLGRCRDRGGSSVAFGSVGGDWTLVVPEDVLRAWFDAPKTPDEAKTLYQVLAVKETATDAEIKAAHRRLARTWHPDICKEPDATEQFRAIQAAYEVLADSMKRKKYNAGLAFQRIAENAATRDRSIAKSIDLAADYCPPYRCGYVLVEGSESVGRFNVTKILQWEDVTDSKGRTMVTSWAKDAKSFRVDWV